MQPRIYAEYHEKKFNNFCSFHMRHFISSKKGCYKENHWKIISWWVRFPGQESLHFLASGNIYSQCSGMLPTLITGLKHERINSAVESGLHGRFWSNFDRKISTTLPHRGRKKVGVGENCCFTPSQQLQAASPSSRCQMQRKRNKESNKKKVFSESLPKGQT